MTTTSLTAIGLPNGWWGGRSATVATADHDHEPEAASSTPPPSPPRPPNHLRDNRRGRGGRPRGGRQARRGRAARAMMVAGARAAAALLPLLPLLSTGDAWRRALVSPLPLPPPLRVAAPPRSLWCPPAASSRLCGRPGSAALASPRCHVSRGCCSPSCPSPPPPWLPASVLFYFSLFCFPHPVAVMWHAVWATAPHLGWWGRRADPLPDG